MTLDQLADRIQIVDDTLRQQTAHAVNCMLTARNWLIGCYIVEYEQKGADMLPVRQTYCGHCPQYSKMQNVRVMQYDIYMHFRQ